MAKIEKPTTRNPRKTLPDPPAPSSAPGNLTAPETAPASGRVRAKPIDGRTLRRTGRTEQFATRVRPEFRNEIAEIAEATNKKYNEILEECLVLYRREHGLD